MTYDFEEKKSGKQPEQTSKAEYLQTCVLLRKQCVASGHINPERKKRYARDATLTKRCDRKKKFQVEPVVKLIQAATLSSH